MEYIRVRIDARDLRKLRAAGVLLAPHVERGVRRILIRAADNIGLQCRSGGALNRRTGALARSWTVGGGAELETSRSGDGAKGSLASTLVYAAIHEYGGDVRPVRARMLAIPLGPAKTDAGVGRYGSPRQVPGLVLRRSRAGNLLLVKRAKEAQAKGTATGRAPTGQIPPVAPGDEPWFLLRDQVRIPASHYVTLALRKTESEAAGIMEAALAEGLKEMG